LNAINIMGEYPGKFMPINPKKTILIQLDCRSAGWRRKALDYVIMGLALLWSVRRKVDQPNHIR